MLGEGVYPGAVVAMFRHDVKAGHGWFGGGGRGRGFKEPEAKAAETGRAGGEAGDVVCFGGPAEEREKEGGSVDVFAG